MSETQETTELTAAEGETATAVAEAPPYEIKIEDAGPAAKKISVSVPAEYVGGKVTEQFKDLRQEAQLPGFRKGHVPSSLIKKKFDKDIRDQVRRTLIQESYEHAVEKHALQVLGDPEFDDIAKIELKDGEPLNFTFTVELQPVFDLPELSGIKVKKPNIAVTDDHINQAMQNLTEQQGKLEPVAEGGAIARDYVTADVHFKVDGNVILHQHDMTVTLRPGRVGGLMVEDLDKQLEGIKPGETREIAVKAPDDFPAENIRGKEVKIEFTVKELKRIKPAVIDAGFLEELGFADEAELRTALREQMDERITFDIQSAMRRQVSKWLDKQVSFELPPKLSTKQTGRVVSRRAIELMQRGVSAERVEANLEKLREGAATDSARELKNFFILQKLAEEKKVEVGETELNTRIAMIALQRGERPEKLKQYMSKQGDMLMNLYVQMREEKALDAVLQTAEIEEVDPQVLVAEQKAEEEQEAAERKAADEAREQAQAAAKAAEGEKKDDGEKKDEGGSSAT